MSAVLDISATRGLPRALFATFFHAYAARSAFPCAELRHVFLFFLGVVGSFGISFFYFTHNRDTSHILATQDQRSSCII